MTAVVPLSLPQPERLAAVEVFLKANGPGFLGRSVAEDILATELSSPTDGQRVVVSGFRTVQEVEAIRRAFPCVVIGVESSLEVRLTRLTERGRNDHSGSQEAFIRLNGWEYSLGLGRLIYEADHILLNDGPLALLQAQLDTIARSHT
jgi:dephospho-CoA kinase